MSSSTGPERGGWTTVRNTVAGSLWPIPVLFIVVAIALGLAIPQVDRSLQSGSQDALRFAFGGGPSAARTLLSAIATSLVSVTTLLFSLTIVTLQLASSQYSPRLLQTFVRDRVVQVCLGQLLGTFVFALVVLRTVRSADESATGAFVPRLAVTVAFVLTMGAVAALIVFLSHQTNQLRVETMMRDVHGEAAVALDSLDAVGDGSADAPGDRDLPVLPVRALPVCTTSSGFLVEVRERRLVRTLAATGAVLRLDRRPGDPVVAHTPVGWVWAEQAGDEVDVGEIERALGDGLALHHERLDGAGPSYGLRKLVDIAVRGLSPGINDPTTAVHALSHISALVGAATGYDAGPRLVHDEDGVQRLAVPSWDFAALLDLAVTQIRHYGHRESAVAARLFTLLAEVGWRCRTDEQRRVVEHQRDLLVDQWVADPPPGRTTATVHSWALGVDSALAGRWQPVVD